MREPNIVATSYSWWCWHRGRAWSWRVRVRSDDCVGAGFARTSGSLRSSYNTGLAQMASSAGTPRRSQLLSGPGAEPARPRHTKIQPNQASARDARDARNGLRAPPLLGKSRVLCAAGTLVMTPGRGPTLAACKTLASPAPESDWLLSQIAALIAYRSARAATYTLTQLTNNLPSRAPAAAPSLATAKRKTTHCTRTVSAPKQRNECQSSKRTLRQDLTGPTFKQARC